MARGRKKIPTKIKELQGTSKPAHSPERNASCFGADYSFSSRMAF